MRHTKFSGILRYKESPNLGQTTCRCDSPQNKRTCRIMNFALPTDYRIKLKKGEKRDKYQDLPRELKKLWNIKVRVIPIVFEAIDRVTKGLVQGLEEFEIRERVEKSKIHHC